MATILKHRLTTEPVTGTLGAVIGGVDMREVPDADRVAEISAALVEHKVIFFRDQEISLDQHLAFARAFGPLEIHPFTEGSVTGFETGALAPEVLRIESTAARPAAADLWHSDVTWRTEPSLGSILHCLVAPPAGGDTLWADMEAAYEDLPDETKARLEGLVAIHDWHGFRRSMLARPGNEEKVAELQKLYPPAEHPLVRTHPVSGRKCIYVNQPFTVTIKGMDDDQAQAILQPLYRLAYEPKYQVRFRWAKHSVAFWDNRSTQHYAIPDFYPQHRLMERVTVAGDRPA